MEKSETVKRYKLWTDDERGYLESEYVLAFVADALAAQVRELREENANWQESVRILAATAREANDLAEKLEQSLATAREEALNRAAVKIYGHRAGPNDPGFNAFNNGLAIAANCIEAIKEEYRALKPSGGTGI